MGVKSRVRSVSVSLIALLIICLSLGVNAQDAAPENSANDPYWEIQVSPYTLHWSRSSEHKNVYLLGIERNQAAAPSWVWADETLWGVSAFRNSFGQSSVYAYLGYRWNNLFGHQPLSFKLTGGILYGYRKPYENKVPLNYNGFSPGIIPTVGYRLTQNDSIQIGILGTAGLIFMYSRRL
ncbi:MAG: hypothetical protein FWH56_04650 [Betaproteobacteria bacterium]|nr:hypothetical protein [Betaproteobacteria bacterium]